MPALLRTRQAWATTLLAAVLLGLPVVCPAQGEPASPENVATDPIYNVTASRARTRIVERFSRIFQLKRRIRRVDGFDPEVLNVTGVQGRPYQVRVHALMPGVTTVTLTDEEGETYNVEVFVTGDVRHLQAYLERMFPHASVEAVEVRDSVVLRGRVTQPANITKMVEIAEQFYPRVLNQMEVGGIQQVQLLVRVMEVQRSKMRRFGLNWIYNDANGYISVTPGSLQPLVSLDTPIGGPPALGINANSLVDSTITGGLITDNFVFRGFLEALKSEALLKILAEPKLVTTNGRPANMLAGGEFPILVPQSLGTVSVEWREFGVRLEAVPHILGRGRVRLELQPEVSERDFTNSVDVQGVLVPGLTTRRVNTQVEMNFGETFVLAGLISSRNTSATNKVPWLGDIPWIGAAFRREQFEEAETELVIMVTPELVAPMKAEQVPPGGPGAGTTAPTDRELYIDGMIELPNYGDGCVDCGPGGFPTTGGYSPMHAPGMMESYPSMPVPVPDRSLPPATTSPTPTRVQSPSPMSKPMPKPGPEPAPPAGPALDVPQPSASADPGLGPSPFAEFETRRRGRIARANIEPAAARNTPVPTRRSGLITPTGGRRDVGSSPFDEPFGDR